MKSYIQIFAAAAIVIMTCNAKAQEALAPNTEKLRAECEVSKEYKGHNLSCSGYAPPPSYYTNFNIGEGGYAEGYKISVHFDTRAFAQIAKRLGLPENTQDLDLYISSFTGACQYSFNEEGFPDVTCPLGKPVGLAQFNWRDGGKFDSVSDDINAVFRARPSGHKLEIEFEIDGQTYLAAEYTGIKIDF